LGNGVKEKIFIGLIKLIIALSVVFCAKIYLEKVANENKATQLSDQISNLSTEKRVELNEAKTNTPAENQLDFVSYSKGVASFRTKSKNDISYKTGMRLKLELKGRKFIAAHCTSEPLEQIGTQNSLLRFKLKQNPQNFQFLYFWKELSSKTNETLVLSYSLTESTLESCKEPVVLNSNWLAKSYVLSADSKNLSFLVPFKKQKGFVVQKSKILGFFCDECPEKYSHSISDNAWIFKAHPGESFILAKSGQILKAKFETIKKESEQRKAKNQNREPIHANNFYSKQILAGWD
jgi:hypothetical protein